MNIKQKLLAAILLIILGAVGMYGALKFCCENANKAYLLEEGRMK